MGISAVLLLVLVTGQLAPALRRKSDGMRRSSFVETRGKAEQLWDAYVRDVQSTYASYGGVQKGCVPQMHKNQGGYRGSIILFHGFTACPQQFEHLVPKLTQAGYTVLTPLNPGHGMALKDGEDQYDLMPTKKEDFAEFGKRMHAIMMAAEGQRGLFGLSLGGTIASYVGKMGGFDRRFVAVPFITMVGQKDLLLKHVSRVPGLRKITMGWGDGCEVERQACRAGICHFSPDIGGAARQFGLDHLANVSSSDEASNGQLQMVFVENDVAVSSVRGRELAKKFGLDPSSKYLCGLDESIGHSFLSPYDTPDQNKYWMGEVEQMVVNFLTEGTPLPQGGGTIEGSQRCGVKCTANSCPYASVAQSC